MMDVQGIGMTSERTRLRLIERLRQMGISNEAVLNAIMEVPRHVFIDEAISHRAYEDTALPIGFGQTISQPYIVAKMTSVLLAEGQLHNVLEVGTGSGYQSAILGKLCAQVTSIERCEPLLKRSKRLLSKLGYRNISCHLADGNHGFAKNAPYDGIIVTAAPEDVPANLIEQLAEGGRLVIPVGTNAQQELRVLTRVGEDYHSINLELVKFVPLLAGTQS